MSKLCLVEVGKFLGILKSQQWFKWPKFANGPIFLPWFIIPSLCTTTWPKGKYFLIFYLFIWIIIYINSFKLLKYMKNIKLDLKNLFVHILDSIFRAHPNMARFGWFEHDWTKMHMKKIQKDLKEIKYAKQWMPWILCSFVDLIASIHNQNHKPNANTL